VTPHGQNFVIVSSSPRDGGLFVFARDASTGALTLRTCYTVSAKPPCAAALAPPTTDLVFAPDGTTLVAVSETYDPNAGPGFGHISVLHLDTASGE
jgi:hypothetical protein